MSNDNDMTVTVGKTGTVSIEFIAGPLIMFWGLQRLRNQSKVSDFTGGNSDAILDSVAIDPNTLIPGETFPYGMAILAPSRDVTYDAVVRIIQQGQTLSEVPFRGELKANKAINCAGIITLVRTS
jgi:hypothetical protein